MGRRPWQAPPCSPCPCIRARCRHWLARSMLSQPAEKPRSRLPAAMDDERYARRRSARGRFPILTGQSGEIALMAEPVWQFRLSVGNEPLFSVLVRTQGCQTLPNAHPWASHPIALQHRAGGDDQAPGRQALRRQRLYRSGPVQDTLAARPAPHHWYPPEHAELPDAPRETLKNSAPQILDYVELMT